VEIVGGNVIMEGIWRYGGLKGEIGALKIRRLGHMDTYGFGDTFEVSQLSRILYWEFSWSMAIKDMVLDTRGR
jgi:hypothetical protein